MRKVFIVLMILMLCLASCSENAENNETVNQSGGYKIISEDLTVGEGTEWALPAVLTLPENYEGKMPAVVIVHGSGPSNMDGTSSSHVYSLYKDLAEYLSSQGIAVLRYDKRTFTHNSKFIDDFNDVSARNYIINEESVYDAILAANILKNDGRIDSAEVFMLGHSLGGLIAPRIDAEGGDFAGLIIMAGSPRRFADIWYDQAVNEGFEQADEYMEYFNSFKDMTDAEAKQYYILGATGYYFKDLDAYPSNEYLKNISKPVLIMQGGKDIQVFADIDYAEYETLLQGKNNIAFKLYPELNHFFVTSTTGTADEYKTRGAVSSEALKDIADWIKAN